MTDAELLGRLLTGACEVDERLLEELLAEGVPATVAVRRAARSRWHAGAALLLGGVIALGSSGTVAAREAAAAPTARVAAITAAAPVAAVEARAPAAVAELAPAELAELALVPGTALVLPALGVNAEGLAAPDMQTPGTYYVVRSGDTLSGIALAAYGNAGLWRIIYDSNVGAIANANLIYPGQQLYIPPLNQAPTGGTPGGMTPGSQTGQGMGRYTVVSGDTLSGIAQRAYGNGGYWYVIYNANTSIIANPSLIYPGQVLTIPANPGTGVVNPGGGQTGQGPGQYTVRSGDSLWSIAQYAYGNPSRWIDIYNANRGLIGADPGLIFSGTVLTIPA